MPNGNTFCGETRNTLKKINVTGNIVSDKVKVPQENNSQLLGKECAHSTGRLPPLSLHRNIVVIGLILTRQK